MVGDGVEMGGGGTGSQMMGGEVGVGAVMVAGGGGGSQIIGVVEGGGAGSHTTGPSQRQLALAPPKAIIIAMMAV